MVDAPPPTCLNCGASSHGRFCADCGQRTDTCVPTLRVLAREGVEAFLSVDSKLWRTLRLLFLQPGALTAEYIAGRRAAYVPPIQLYVWLQALVLFLYATVVPKGSAGHRDRAFFVTGLALAALFGLVFRCKGRPGALHFVAALHVVSFYLFLVLADSLYVRLILPSLRVDSRSILYPMGVGAVGIALFVHIAFVARRAYGEGIASAILRALGVIAALWGVELLLTSF